MDDSIKQRVLTDADLKAFADLLEARHGCRFDNITPQDMDFLKDLVLICKETRSEVIKWIVKGIVYSILLLILVGIFFKYNFK